MLKWEKAMTPEEIQRVMEQEDISLGKDTAGAVVHGGPTTDARDELVRVDRMYGEAVGYARSFLDDAKEGRPPDLDQAAPLVNNFIDSVFRNESAAAAISKLKAFDEYTFTHCINVSILAVILGKRLGYSREKLELIGVAGMFHDLGKAQIPDKILNKPGKLSEREMNVMRTHPLLGFETLRKNPYIPEDVLLGALEHHEKYDGSGYPRGLKEEDISDIGRLLAVVDVYDALTSERVYKAPLPPGKVLAMIYKWRSTDFHAGVVEEFIKSLGVYPVGSFVRLSTGEYAVVLDHTPENPLRPKVKIVFSASFKSIQATEIDLNEADIKVTEVLNPSEHKVNIYRLM